VIDNDEEPEAVGAVRTGLCDEVAEAVPNLFEAVTMTRSVSLVAADVRL
jgi:hypothetical protein